LEAESRCGSPRRHHADVLAKRRQILLPCQSDFFRSECWIERSESDEHTVGVCVERQRANPSNPRRIHTRPAERLLSNSTILPTSGPVTARRIKHQSPFRMSGAIDESAAFGQVVAMMGQAQLV